MTHTRRSYVTALGYNWLTPLYDPLVRLTTRELTFKRCLLEQAHLQRGDRVLDIGCGTGTLMLLTRDVCPGVSVCGVDGDPNILRIARSKGGSDPLALVRSMSFELPFAAGSFCRVTSTLMLHHLTREEKLRTLREAFRVLRPGGELHVADWGKPDNAVMLALSGLLVFGKHENRLADNREGRLPELFERAGFADAQERTRFATLFGTLSLYSGRRPTV